ncbi:TPA: hypothetical protein I6Y71_004416 [Vibrio parahaemolyticus]|uniref:hypothetical protein n=1 Tax=Vibrio parahaemolyticus TaxID=670 RepID=UPI00111ED98D|nr:hypothetical protein [Vibrio parahaemolyticus]MBD2853066.1 hypothetical protein [Vibrio parahaemolyticus]TPA32378.1 hypothetical protein DXJ85_24940 [Vibrio parahaemolyticus]HAS3131070.1 hypothetical protein [Vibrio parahaemolyticus]
MGIETAFNIVSAALVSIGGGAAVILGLSSFLGKLWAERILSEEKAKYEKELERYRDELAQLSFENQYRFQRLHERRVEVIAETYSLLRKAFNALDPLAFGKEESKENNAELARAAVTELYTYFPKNRIYISYEIARKITKFQGDIENTIAEFELHEYACDYSSKYDRVHGQLSSALTELEFEFRRLLGESVPQREK